MAELSSVFETLLREVWNKLDTGKDGSVSPGEFKVGINELLPNPSADKIEKTIA